MLEQQMAGVADKFDIIVDQQPCAPWLPHGDFEFVEVICKGFADEG